MTDRLDPSAAPCEHVYTQFGKCADCDEPLPEGDDEMKVIRLTVTNPAGQTFPAFLVDGGFSKAGVVEFYVAPGDAPPGEATGKRCEFYRPVHASRPPYIVKRETLSE